jgi:hypothetical protein
MGVFAGTERQCIEDEHDDEDENDSLISEFGFNSGIDISPLGAQCIDDLANSVHIRDVNAFLAATEAPLD